MAIQRDKVIANAEKLVAKGKIEPAIKEYERLLDDNPNDVNTLNRIGDLWVRINRTDEAVKTFGRIADHYARDGFFLKAIAIYKKINKLDPSKLEVYGKLADLYAKQGLAMEAKSQYQVLADYYLKHGDPNNALGIYRKISELDPQSINVHVKLADLHSQIGQTAEALKEYDRVGRMLLKRGMLEEAVQVFKKALKIDAKNIDLVDSLVTALVEAKDYNNAVTIVEHALEANRDHPRLLALWGKILIGKGDIPSARNALEKGLRAEPNDPSIREALGDLYLKQNDANKALEMIVPLVEKSLSRGERGQAVEMLNKVLRVDQRHTPTLERLVAVYTRLNEETNILSSMNLLAEAHIARGQFAPASEVLQRLIDREPQNAQHRTKLQFVKSQMSPGEKSAPPIRPKTVQEVPMPPMEVEEPAPTFEITEEAPALSLDDSGPPIELDFTGDMEIEAPTPISAEAEMTAMEAESSDDLDFITEHLTEAEVFAKYGLAEKAIEHLRAVIDRVPKHMPAYDRLFRVLLDEGDVEGARTTAKQYLTLLEEAGDQETVAAVNNEFLSRGHTLKPAAAKPAPAAKPAAAPPPKPAAKPAPAPIPEPEPEPELELEVVEEEEMSFDLDSSPAAPEIELEAPEPEPEPVEELSFGDSPEISLDSGEQQPFYGVEATAEEVVVEEPTAEEINEIDFFIEQEMFDEAREKADMLLARFPDNFEITSRLERIEEGAAAAAAPPPPPPPPPPKPVAKAAPPAPKAAPPPPPKPAPPPPPPAKPKMPSLSQPKPPALSREEIDSELLSAIPDDEDFGGGTMTPAPAPPPPAAAPAPVPQFAAAPAQEENLFADEDDFFDLAAELESELQDGDEVVSLSEEEQSLEEIFKEFKKGVEQQLDSEDYDTHYNLGIAYKEMGLIDEAIGEFQLASKDPKRAVECASMLGLCFLEKGMPQLAIKWYRKGLEMPEIKEDEHIGLLYDLGSAYVEVGDTDNAQKAFMEVYSLNSNYRDIVGRIKQVEDAKR